MHEAEVFYFINGFVHDYHEAKHLTIEAFAQLAVGGKKFAEKSSLKTYLFTIGKNLALRYIKMQKTEMHISFDEIVETFVSENETPYRFTEREENKRQIREAISDLKEDYRVVLILLYFEDMSYKQAGRIMNKSEKQIKYLAYNAKAALKKRLANRGFTYV